MKLHVYYCMYCILISLKNLLLSSRVFLRVGSGVVVGSVLMLDGWYLLWYPSGRR